MDKIIIEDFVTEFEKQKRAMLSGENKVFL